MNVFHYYQVLKIIIIMIFSLKDYLENQFNDSFQDLQQFDVLFRKYSITCILLGIKRSVWKKKFLLTFKKIIKVQKTLSSIDDLPIDIKLKHFEEVILLLIYIYILLL